jgi:hypothetical protein
MHAEMMSGCLAEVRLLIQNLGTEWVEEGQELKTHVVQAVRWFEFFCVQK